MRRMEMNDWIILNNIIYKIYSMENFNEMRHELLSQLKMIFDYDSADFYMVSKEEGRLIGDPVTFNCDVDLSEEYEEFDYAREVIQAGKTLIYRDTDVIPDEARTQTEYYQKVFKNNNWNYSLRIIVSRDRKFLGTITFYRTIGKENFSSDDIFVLDMLKDHLSFRLEQYVKNNESAGQKYTITEAVHKYSLTKREDKVLRMLMSGRDNDSICNELVITPNTLKKHILNIYRKLGIRNRVQLFKMIKERE